MNEIELLKQRVEMLENILADLAYSDRFIFQKNIQILDGRSIQTSSDSGTRICTAATQKIAFWGKTPIVQAGAIPAPSNPGGVYSQSEASSAVTAINNIRTVLSNMGITA